MAKERVSLTLDEDLVDRIDAEAERNDVNRSQQVEDILESYFNRQAIDTAVVFCGDDDLKALREYKGRPVLEHVLEHLSDQEITRAFLLAGRNEDEISDELGSRYDGVSLNYVSEEDPEGTAAALEKVEEEISRTFVAVNGHVITDVDIQEMLEIHRDEESISTMALTSVEDPSGYGVVRLKGRKVLGFEEKPESYEHLSRLINAGTYIFEPGIFDYLDSDSLEDAFEDLAGRGLLSGYIYGGKWKDLSR
ncbi:MAG: sugar phosphate nucleotidyltransferase [Candidatus Nanosalina sp.]